MNYKLLAWYIVTTLAVLLIASVVYAERHPKLSYHSLILTAEAQTWLEEIKGTKLYELAKCESGLNPLAVNPHDTNGLSSNGLFQYQIATWNMWTKQIDPEKKWDIWEPEHQIEVTQWALKHGLSTAWPTCGRQVGI